MIDKKARETIKEITEDLGGFRMYGVGQFCLERDEERTYEKMNRLDKNLNVLNKKLDLLFEHFKLEYIEEKTNKARIEPR